MAYSGLSNFWIESSVSSDEGFSEEFEEALLEREDVRERGGAFAGEVGSMVLKRVSRLETSSETQTLELFFRTSRANLLVCKRNKIFLSWFRRLFSLSFLE